MKEPKSWLIVALYLCLAVASQAEVVDSEMLLQPLDRHLRQSFGFSVAINGTNAVVGATEDALNIGAAYVYSKFGSNWVLRQKLVPPQGATNELIGASVAIDGNILAVGAPGFTTNLSTANPGGVYMFQQTNGVWGPPNRLNAPDAQRGDRFGDSVAISGQSVVIGCPFHSDFGATNNGAIYVFDLTAIGWQLSAKLLPRDLTNSSFLGQRVSMSGNTVIAGANNSLVGPTNFQVLSPGAAYIFTRTPVTSFYAPWNLEQKLMPANFANAEQFGFSVAIDGDTALVGAPAATNGGAVYTFLRTGSNVWTPQTTLVASNLTNGDNFGWSVSLQGTRAVIGAPSRGSNDIPGLGAAFVFSETNLIPNAFAFAPTNVIIPTNVVGSTNLTTTTNAFATTNVILQPPAPPALTDTNIVTNTNALADTNVFAPTNVLTQLPTPPALSDTNVFAETNAFGQTNVVGITNTAGETNVVVLTNTGTNFGWVQQQELRPLQTATNFNFGFSVSIGTDGIIVGTPAPIVSRGNGVAYVFGNSESAVSIVSVRATPAVLVPQSHLLVPVTITVVTTGSNVTSRIVSVTSNQAVVGRGINRTSPDWVITGDLTVQLRAEGNDNVNVDRIYNVTVESIDPLGNFALTTVPVIVPHTLGGTASITPTP